MAKNTKTETPEMSEAGDDRKRLFDRIEGIHRSWLERMRELHNIEAEFSAKLLSSSGAEEATAICNQWMAKRLALLGSEQQALAKAWTDIVGLVGESAKSVFLKRKG